jgi:hypothetical protein
LSPFSILGLLHANTNGFSNDSNARSEDSSDGPGGSIAKVVMSFLCLSSNICNKAISMSQVADPAKISSKFVQTFTTRCKGQML